MRLFLLFVAGAVMTVSAEIVDLGKLAATYEISEPDMLVQVTQRIAALDRQTIVDQYQRMLKDAMRRDSGLPTCIQDTTYTRPYEVVTKGAYAMSAQPYITPGEIVHKVSRAPSSVCLVDATTSFSERASVDALSISGKSCDKVMVSGTDILGFRERYPQFTDVYPYDTLLGDALQFSCQPSRVFVLGDTLTIDEFSIAKRGG